MQGFYSAFLYNAYHGTAILIWVYFLLYLLSVVRNFASILKISIFTIKSKNDKEIPLEDSPDIENGKEEETEKKSTITQEDQVKQNL